MKSAPLVCSQRIGNGGVLKPFLFSFQRHFLQLQLHSRIQYQAAMLDPGVYPLRRLDAQGLDKVYDQGGVMLKDSIRRFLPSMFATVSFPGAPSTDRLGMDEPESPFFLHRVCIQCVPR